MTEQELLALGPALAKFLSTFLFCCDYTQTFGHLSTYVHGLLSDLPRKSVEPIALQAGTPVRTLQEFVKDHAWDCQRVGELLQGHAAAALAQVPDADDLGTVGLIDETGTPKKGDKTPGVQRQWCGRLGKVENCVVTVHLGVARGRYKTLIDADLFLPESWSGDRKRCREAGIPATLVHRTKGCIALTQLDRAKERGVRLDWLTFDEEYGKSPGFIAGLQERDLCFVGEVPRTLSCLVVNRPGRRPAPEVPSRTAEQVAANTTAFRTQRWQVVRLSRQTQPDQVWRVKAARVWLHGASGWSEQTYWLIWASNDATGEEKFFLSNAAADTPVETLVRVAFRRWNVEHTFRVAKTELGFGHFEGRNYVALMRHMSLCLVAMAFVAEQADRLRGKKIGSDAGTGMPSSACDLPGVVGSATGHQRQAVRTQCHRTPPKSQPRRTPIASQERARRPNTQEAPAMQTSRTKTSV